MVYIRNLNTMQRFIENVNLSRRVSEQLSEGLQDIWTEEKSLQKSYQTFLYDTLVDLQTGKQTIIHNGQSNRITFGFGILVASLLKGDATFGFPLTYWAVGEGEGNFWDDLSIDARQSKSLFSLSTLYNEINRQPVSIEYIDENNDVVSGPTNKIEVRAVFGPDVTGTLREFGVYGGNATTTVDSGILIDHKSHTAINLNNTPGQQNVLIRALRITL